MEKSLHYALYLLTYRDRSVNELWNLLLRKGYSEEEVSSVVETLCSWNYLNDRRFAETWVEARLRLKPMGPFRLEQELRRKGVADEVIEKVLGDVFSIVSEEELAQKLAEKKMKNRPWRRVENFLRYRGFSWGVIEALRIRFNQHSYD